jgi:hypothetical protein
MTDSEIYAYIADEVRNKRVDPGLWTQAFAESEGNETRTIARYAKLRFNQIKSDQAARNLALAKTALKRGTSKTWEWTKVGLTFFVILACAGIASVAGKAAVNAYYKPSGEELKEKILSTQELAKLPYRLDEYTTLEKITEENRVLIYWNALNGFKASEIDNEQFRGNLFSIVAQKVCPNIKPLLHDGYKVAYAYTVDGLVYGRITLDHRVCSAKFLALDDESIEVFPPQEVIPVTQQNVTPTRAPAPARAPEPSNSVPVVDTWNYNSAGPYTSSCVIKPVMTDAELAACRTK